MLLTYEKRSKRDQDMSYYYHSMPRVVLAALMGVGVVAHVYLNTPSPKWLIYMTDQVRFFLKSWEKLFPGHHLVSCPLCSSCIAGPLGKVQVVVGLILWLQSLFQTTKVGRSDPSFPLQALLGSWGGFGNSMLIIWELHPFFRIWSQPSPSWSLSSTGPCSILKLWNMVSWRWWSSSIQGLPGSSVIIYYPSKEYGTFTNFWMCWFCPQAHWPI